tara:strand:- start:1479 stop:1589 length:111 start_codon:yes stop_codon:yes gene_type:complete
MFFTSCFVTPFVAGLINYLSEALNKGSQGGKGQLSK